MISRPPDSLGTIMSSLMVLISVTAKPWWMNAGEDRSVSRTIVRSMLTSCTAHLYTARYHWAVLEVRKLIKSLPSSKSKHRHPPPDHQLSQSSSSSSLHLHQFLLSFVPSSACVLLLVSINQPIFLSFQNIIPSSPSHYENLYLDHFDCQYCLQPGRLYRIPIWDVSLKQEGARRENEK